MIVEIVLAAMAGTGSTDWSAGPSVQLTLEQAQQLHASPADLTAKPSIKEQRLQVAAQQIGTVQGFAEYQREMEAKLQKYSHELDEVFAFGPLMIPVKRGYLVVPPVVRIYAGDVQVGEDGQSLRTTTSRLKIVAPAHLVAQMPSWRNYLLAPPQTIPAPDKRTFPRDAGEQKIWAAVMARAWAQGRTQAAEVYRFRFKKLEDEYTGMLNYLELVAKGMVREIYVADQDLGIEVTGSRGTPEMVIGGTYVKITRPIGFEDNVGKWKPISIPFEREKK